MHNDKLTEQEHQEFIQLIDKIEQADADRIQALVELANTRAVSVDALMQQLNIHTKKSQLV